MAVTRFLILLGLVMLAFTASASGSEPPLRVSKANMRAALKCPEGPERRSRGVALLVHGTATNDYESWSAGYLRALPRRGYEVCTVRLPARALGDIQRSSEYVVFAIRRLAGRSSSGVEVIGHSQGALQPRWALRWWRDTRGKVDDYVSLAGPHHGVSTANGLCGVGTCAPAVWQMRRGSDFLAALNRAGETPRGPSYTSIYSHNDELVVPTSTSLLKGASNVAIQDLCPLRYVSHAAMLWDAVTYSLVVDALEHRGPARPDRVSSSVCAGAFMPGATIPALPANPAQYTLDGFRTWASSWRARREPRLARYAR